MSHSARLLALLLCFSALALGQSPSVPQANIPLTSLAAFKNPPADWQLAGGIGGDPRHDTALRSLPGTGVLLNNATSPGARHALVTSKEYGDVDLELDFLLTPNADAMVYLQGRYGVHLVDGAVGIPPVAHAGRAPGLWQHLKIEFRAARFDSGGRKNTPARFARIIVNDFTSQENIELTAPSSGAPYADERPVGPVIVSNGQGALALRALTTHVPVAPAPSGEAAAKATPKNAKKKGNGKAAPAAKKATVIPVDVTDSIIVQRGFIPYEPKKRLYAASVGTPAGVHFAYDFETGALLRVWRGRFIDAGEMWEGRSPNQWAKPTGPALTLNALPTIARIASPASGDWPLEPDPLAASQGYRVEPDGQPVFLSTLATLSIQDRIAPAPEARGLTRTLSFGGTIPAGAAQILIARNRPITPQPGGIGYVVGDREYYIDFPATTTLRPVIRTVGDHQLLVVPLAESMLTQPIVYTLVW